MIFRAFTRFDARTSRKGRKSDRSLVMLSVGVLKTAARADRLDKLSFVRPNALAASVIVSHSPKPASSDLDHLSCRGTSQKAP